MRTTSRNDSTKSYNPSNARQRSCTRFWEELTLKRCCEFLPPSLLLFTEGKLSHNLYNGDFLQCSTKPDGKSARAALRDLAYGETGHDGETGDVEGQSRGLTSACSGRGACCMYADFRAKLLQGTVLELKGEYARIQERKKKLLEKARRQIIDLGE